MSNNQEGQYWDIINRHPDAKLVGLTASPMRLGSGKLNWGEIVYEISYHQLLKADYLSPITNKVTGTPNLDNIQIVNSNSSNNGTIYTSDTIFTTASSACVKM